MTMPNFLVIGAPKCGTDALYNHLKLHPQIYMSPVKEPMFFAIDGQVDVPYCGPFDREQLLLECWVPTLERYQALFNGVTSERAIGEASTWYLYSEQAHRRIRQYVPDAKLIAVLRNPVDRAYSAYTMLVRDGRETQRDFRTALAAESKRIELNWQPGWHYVQNGFYHGQLKRYYDTFDRAQIRVFLHDDFISRPATIIAEMFRFLDVDETVSIDTSRHTNVSFVPKHFQYHQLLAGQHPMKKLLKSVLPEGLRQNVKDRLMSVNMTKPEPLAADVRYELQQVYREDILRLQDLIGRDLSGWLQRDESPTTTKVVGTR